MKIDWDKIAMVLGASGVIAILLKPKAADAAIHSKGPVMNPGSFTAKHYPPFSNDAYALFAEAARQANLPAEWARDQGLHNILHKESGGYVGRPNYQFGVASPSKMDAWPAIWASIRNETWRDVLAEPYRSGDRAKQSSATGLGQMIRSNVDAYYPSKRNGIGRPVEEAIGMLRYIKARYGTPANAWAKYGVDFEGY